jgi:hypothetical protein
MAAFEAPGQPEQAWKVGALARTTGLTVRTLHSRERIGLLVPSGVRPPVTGCMPLPTRHGSAN